MSILTTLALLPYICLSATPVMGWSSWNTYRINISDSLIMRQADAMVSRGLAQAGYSYINIDDGYFGGRDSMGRLLTHPIRFPSGLKHVVRHIHDRGLKAGIYTDAGRNTCGNFWDHDSIATGVGMYGHDDTDAQFFFIDNGFDFIKVDFCGGDARQNTDSLALDEQTRYRAIAEAIKATGRTDVKLNVCRWAYPGTWVSDVASSWRISHDITPHWGAVKTIINRNMYLSAYCRNGAFNDMDMLEVGRGMTPEEDATHFGMWCIMSSPLMIGCDIGQADSATVALLSNPELIALNQDPLALQAYPVKAENGYYILAKDIAEPDGLTRAIAFYNPTDSEVTATLPFTDVQLGGKVKLRDVMNRTDAGIHIDSFSVTLPPHATRIYTATAEHRIPREIYEAETGFITSYQEIHSPHLTGRYVADASCSTGAKAAYLGGAPDNDISWDNVSVPDRDGIHDITICGITPDTRTLSVEINGSHAATLTFSEGRTNASIKAFLSKGRNRIRLHNDTGAMPDIDYIKVSGWR
ncbi:MAG: alpha-galactosidase [Muribaculaceae bacterium]|nr:alpha-galactosidase [Muribaculaceae bacterium]